MSGTVDVIVPRDIDDSRHPSGGNGYDRHLIDALPAAGWTVRTHRVRGGWPHPDACALRALAFALTPRPGATPVPVLVDGMLAAAAGDMLQHAARVRPVAILSHMLFGARDDALTASERVAVASAHAVVAVSQAAARPLRAAGVPASRLHVVTPGADRAPIAAPSDAGGRMLCVAAVSAAKGQDTLVDALARLPRETRWSCACAGALDGDPAFTTGLRETIAAAGVADRVTLIGPLDGTALDAAYAATDLVVLPSRGETWGLALTEALAHGIPVVACDVGGVREAVGAAPDGTVPGLLVPVGDAAALAAALATWLADDALRSRLRHAAAARAGMLPSWDEAAARVAAVLDAARDEWRGGHAGATGGPPR